MKLLFPVFLLLTIVIVSALVTNTDAIGPEKNLPLFNNTSTYSIVHLSDTQNLATYFPDTYNFTFSYLDSIKNEYNISAIVITGDLVNTWNNRSEWNAYANAVKKTSIPIYTIAGNHDNYKGKNSSYYETYTGDKYDNYVTSLDDFNFVGINYLKDSLNMSEIASIKRNLNQTPNKFTIIATHYYMDSNKSLSNLGKEIDKELTFGPVIIMAGHKYINYMNITKINNYPVIRDITNYQNGIKDGKTKKNYSAGNIYNITSKNGVIERISAKTIEIYPEERLSNEKVLYEKGNSSILEP